MKYYKNIVVTVVVTVVVVVAAVVVVVTVEVLSKGEWKNFTGIST